MLENLKQVLDILNDVPAEVWSVVIETVVGALIVSPVMLGIKKWFSIDGEKKMVVFVMIGSMLAAVAAYMLTVPEFAPWLILVQGWLVFATTQPVYYLFIKPLVRKLGAWFTDQIAKAAAISEAKAAAVPATGLPLPGSGNMFDDFH